MLGKSFSAVDVIRRVLGESIWLPRNIMHASSLTYFTPLIRSSDGKVNRGPRGAEAEGQMSPSMSECESIVPVHSLNQPQ